MEIKGILDLLGFKHVKKRESEAFGDSENLYVSPDLHLRVVRDRGVESVEIACPSDPTNWFDLSLVKAWMEKVEGERITLNSEESFVFLQKNYTAIRNSFLNDSVGRTKTELLEKSTARAKKMFPGLYRE